MKIIEAKSAAAEATTNLYKLMADWSRTNDLWVEQNLTKNPFSTNTTGSEIGGWSVAAVLKLNFELQKYSSLQ